MYKLQRKSKKRKGRLGYLLDATYSKKYEKVGLFFLDPKTQTIFSWDDVHGDRPYLYTNATPQRVADYLKRDPTYLGAVAEEKYNAVLDMNDLYTKVTASSPLSIGGKGQKSFRNVMLSAGFSVWEETINYVNSYCYDMGLEMGMPYIVTPESVEPYIVVEHNKRIENVLARLSPNVDITDEIIHWVRLFEAPLPDFKFLAIDIEVLPDNKYRMPDAIKAEQPVIAISHVGSDGKRITYVLERDDGVFDGDEFEGEVVFFDNQRDLIFATFKLMAKYPFIITFNGDAFDLMYLYNKANQLYIPKKYNPIYVTYRKCKLKRGIHIDLYPFMKNPSIKNYAYKGKYQSFSLDAISKGLLGRGKIEYEGKIGDLTYNLLVKYCLTDSILVYDLCSANNNSLLILILMLTRMSNLTIYDLNRRAISSWVSSTFFYMSRIRNWLIPNRLELRSKGVIQTKAKVKGKKYEGAIVTDPRSGIFFDVTVVDFASLYPSEVKEKNIGFGTVNCRHLECRSNKVPDTTHHICTINRSIEADIIGGLKDTRVFFYKEESKNKQNPLKELYVLLEQAIKVYVNAAYGVFGSENFPLHCPPVAESIASYSRRDMQSITDRAEKIGADPLYGDTDSVFLYHPTKKQIEDLQEWAHTNLSLDLGVDTTYRYAIFSYRKKNYLGIREDGTADIKGLTGKKRQIPKIIKNSFFDVIGILEKVQDEKEYIESKDAIITIIINAYNKIKNREWDNINDMVFNIRLGKNLDEYIKNIPQHVKAGRVLAAIGYDIKKGDDILFLKTKTEGGVLPLTDDFKPQYVDTKPYIKQLRTVFEQLIESMDIDWDMHIEKRPSQIKLFSFMMPPE